MLSSYATIIRILAILLMTAKLTQCSSSASLYYAGIAELSPTSGGSNFSPDADYARGLRGFLAKTLRLNISALRRVIRDDDAEATNSLVAAFEGYIADFEDIASCLRQKTFHGDRSMNVSHDITSISLQNFQNESVLRQNCQRSGKNLAYITEYFQGEVECTLPKIQCEQSLIRQVFRYNIYENSSNLYTFYCALAVKENECVTADEWLQLDWTPTCEPIAVNNFMPSSLTPHGLEFGKGNDLKMEELSFHCANDWMAESGGGPPIIHLLGDRTWAQLPPWLRKCLQVINGVALVAFLLCLLTFAVFRELRNAHGKNAMSLVIAAITSLFYTSGYIPLETGNAHLCVFIGVLLYYAVLIPNYCWMAVAIFLGWTLGRPGIHRIDSSGNRAFMLLFLLGWGVPLFFTLLILFLHVGGVTVFRPEKHCWIYPLWPNWVLLAETLIPFFVDCALFGLVAYRLRESQNSLTTFKNGGKSRVHGGPSERRLAIKMAAIFGVLWFPCWICYIFFLAFPVPGLAIATQVLNQLSIFTLPLVLCCSPKVARLWRKRLAPVWERLSSTPSTSRSNQLQSNDLPQPARENRAVATLTLHENIRPSLNRENKDSLEMEGVQLDCSELANRITR